MITRIPTKECGCRSAGEAARDRLLAAIPVTERRLELAGIPTAVLEGDDGPPVVLLHGPGESALRVLMRKLGIPAIPPADLARIAVPTRLVWGRHDRANRLRIAKAASARYGWPLHVIEDAADDPKLEQPEAFLTALGAALPGS